MRRHLVLADIERPEHCGLGGALALAVVDCVDQHGDAEHVGQEDEFLAGIRAFLAGAGQEIDGVFPFLEGEAGLAHVIVQRLHQFLEQEFRARVGCLVKAPDDGFGEFSLVELGHGAFACDFLVGPWGSLRLPGGVARSRLHQSAGRR
ncbi:hypothetical protein ACVW0I_002718 [Bradyrhizobium sp. LM6.11]